MTLETFNGDRLVLARKRRGVAKVDLARTVDVGVRTLSNYESGHTSPSPEMVAKLASALQVRHRFFAAASVELPTADAASFRALARMTKQTQDVALAAAAMGVQLHQWLTEEFELPRPDVPVIPSNQPELVADALRASWQIGEGPAPNMVHLLESRGVRVLALPREAVDADGLSFWHNGLPFVLLNTSKSGERSRFDAAHELGHLAMHQHESPVGREAEHQANAFASSFLLPESAIRQRVGSRPISLPLIFAIKHEFAVSAMAVVYRLQRLGLTTEWTARSLFQQLSAKGYRSSEPDGIPREGSQLLVKAMKSLVDSGIGYSEVADRLGYVEADLFSMLDGLAPIPSRGGGGAAAVQSPSESSTGRGSLRLVK